MQYVRLYVNICAGFMLGIFLLIDLGCEAAHTASPATESPATEPILSASRQRVDQEMIKALEAERAGGEVLNVGFVVLEGVFNSELMAPYDVIQHTIFRDDKNYMQPFMVGPSLDPMITFEGIEVLPHFTFEDAPEIDILIIPSTENSMTSDLEDAVFMAWLNKAVAEADYVITVCDGAFPLAATGVLDGRIATTFPGDRDSFAAKFPEIDVRYDQNFVVDGKYITSVGGALSYEPAFYLVEYLYSKENADRIAQGLVWNWNLEQVPHLIVEQNL